MNIKFKVDGPSMSQLVNGLRLKTLEVGRVCKATVNEVGQRIYEDAQERVPKKTGALWASGRLTDTSQGNVAEAVISYGDYTLNPQTGKQTADYAVDRHETPTGPGDKGYKWLENATLDGAPGFLETAQNNLRQVL